MKVSFHFPDEHDLIAFRQRIQELPFSYPEVMGTKEDFPKGYDHDHNQVLLGHGDKVFENAKEAIRNWQMFPKGWTNVFPDNTPLMAGKDVVVLFRLFGLWWWNSARIVYTLNDRDTFGFAYGTLHQHVECGEECFWVEKTPQGEVYYHIAAFSRPRFWLARLGYPVARNYQRKFVRDSFRQMKELVNQKVNIETA